MFIFQLSISLIQTKNTSILLQLSVFTVVYEKIFDDALKSYKENTNKAQQILVIKWFITKDVV